MVDFNLYIISGDLERAVRLFRRSFLTDSGQWMAMVSAGDALKQLGKYHEAEEILSRYISVLILFKLLIN